MGILFPQLIAPSLTGSFITGTGLVLCVTPNGATYALSVDGQISRDIGARDDTACVNYGSETTIIANNLEFGRHKAELRVVTASTEPDFRFWGGLAMTNVAVARCVGVQDFVHFSRILMSTSSSESVLETWIDDMDPMWLTLPGRGENQVSGLLVCLCAGTPTCRPHISVGCDHQKRQLSTDFVI